VIGEYGQVEAIELMTTTLGQGDKSRVIIPNRKIVGEVLQNYGLIRQLSLTVGVAYDANIPEVFATIREVLKDNPRVLKDITPGVGIASLGDSAINIAVKPWTSVSDFGPAGTEIYESLIQKFREKNIQIPFPQREIRLLNGHEEKPATASRMATTGL
jgi:small conductance mechanosensitive channel